MGDSLPIFGGPGLFFNAAIIHHSQGFQMIVINPVYTSKTLRLNMFVTDLLYFLWCATQQNGSAMTLRITFNIPQNKITSFLRLFYCCLAGKKQLEWEEEPLQDGPVLLINGRMTPINGLING